MTAILLSVKPTYADGLLNGTKTAEVRRRFPDQTGPTTVYLYSSSPERAIVGTVTLDSIDRPPARKVWNLYQHRIQILRGPLDDYLENVADAAILQMSNPNRWANPMPLPDLRQRVRVEPPQSFRYLDERQETALIEWAFALATADGANLPEVHA